jgi:hypothetical protein
LVPEAVPWGGRCIDLIMFFWIIYFWKTVEKYIKKFERHGKDMWNSKKRVVALVEESRCAWTLAGGRFGKEERIFLYIFKKLFCENIR